MSTTFHLTGQQSLPNWGDYKEQLAAEELEIGKIRWLESEKAGQDVGYDRAEWIWLTRYRHLWLAARRLGSRD